MVEIDFHYSKGAKKLVGVDPVKFKGIENAVVLSGVVARHIKNRVKNRGDLKGHEKEYSKKKKPFSVPPKYQKEAGVSKNRFKNTHELHKAAGVKKGTYDVTGGMWRNNPRVRNYGSMGEAVIEFVRSSLSSRGKRNKKGKLVDKKVRNALKAAAIFRSHRVNVIAPTANEESAMLSGITWKAHTSLREIFGLKEGLDFESFTPSGDVELFEKIKRSAYNEL